MLRLFGICSDQHISQFFLLSTYNIHWSKIWTHSVPIVNVHGSKQNSNDPIKGEY